MSIFKTTEGREHTGKYVGYLRVSTEKQDTIRQQHIIEKYLNGGDYTLTFFKEEAMSGAVDPYEREQLMKAVDYCRKNKATLVFADLDRLGRKMWMTLKFLDEIVTRYKIKFIICNDPSISEDPMRLHMKALFAEYERQEISRRTRETLAVYQADIKKQGYFISKAGRKINKLGVHSKKQKAGKAAGDFVMQKADRFAKTIYYYLNDAYISCSTLTEMVDYLNDRKVRTPRGGDWYASSVKNMLRRLKIGKYHDK